MDISAKILNCKLTDEEKATLAERGYKMLTVMNEGSCSLVYAAHYEGTMIDENAVQRVLQIFSNYFEHIHPRIINFKYLSSFFEEFARMRQQCLITATIKICQETDNVLICNYRTIGVNSAKATKRCFGEALQYGNREITN